MITTCLQAFTHGCQPKSFYLWPNCFSNALPTNPSLRLWEILLACLKKNGVGMVDFTDVVYGDPLTLIDGKGEFKGVGGVPPL